MTLVLDSATARAVCGLVRDGRASSRSRAPRAATRRSARSCSWTRSSRARAASRRTSRRSSSAAARARSPDCASASRRRAASPWRSAGRALGVSTLEALVAGAPGALALIDARRGELFALGEDGTAVVEQPEGVAARLAPGTLCVGDGARRYRALLEDAGAVVPPDDDARHAPGAQALCALAAGGAPEPVYVRRPDAEPRVA